ncbi:MAG: hypothetical protein UY16_C0007G0011 [Candidatus Gottesmanbacteria bacterium GW2011_GWA2_47_9]|uniref:Uncharacterized protein n=1 Tax=Candidatus Gottesmanbacteria bacterium GW2011_GWA2_47_9 TaxID=1618445 RepID=A0A0G1X1W1_9BACT|nr:MAG: hypothetical protein UY16_C0007G0011 [Candidatus Gottesmanbacteria bacterium GW2011_GWA2_47_9]
MIELFLSTDGKHTCHVQADTTEAMDKLLPYAKALYLKIVAELGTKAQMWQEAMSGNGKHQQTAPFGKRIDTPEQAQALFAPPCPVHQTPMKKRQGQYGEFWSCGRKLPTGAWCNQTMPISGEALRNQ